MTQKKKALTQADQHEAIKNLIAFCGDDPERSGMLETPARFVKAMQAYTSGYTQSAAAVLKTFEDGAEHYDQLVTLTNIPISSLCEHHLAPFIGYAHIAYIPAKRIVGLSKLSRLVDVFAKRFQVQERLTNQIADALDSHLKPLGVAVVLEARHMCMELRGIKQHGITTSTSALRGAFMHEPETRAEFMSLVRSNRKSP